MEGVAKNPMQKLQFEHNEKGGAGDYETKLLETTIEKITSLLRIGFGIMHFEKILKANI